MSEFSETHYPLLFALRWSTRLVSGMSYQELLLCLYILVLMGCWAYQFTMECLEEVLLEVYQYQTLRQGSQTGGYSAL